MRRSHGDWRLRLALVVAGAAVFGGTVAWRSSTESFEARLVNVVAQRSLPKAAYDALQGSPRVAAMVVDAANAPEVRFKMQLALIKYGDHAKRVLEAYGDEPRLHALLTRFGEQVVPPIAFFMENDLLVLKLLDTAVGLVETAKKMSRRALRHADGEALAPAPPELFNTPFKRGLLAMAHTDRDGHRFLAQFDVQADGTARWNMTDRMAASGEKAVLGGLRDFETKHNIGERIGVADIVWAGADVAVMFSIAKSLSLAAKARAAGKEVQGAGILARSPGLTQVPRGLDRTAAGTLRLGAKVSAVYLLASHPGLLTALFAEVGALLGIQAWMAVALGWWAVGFVLISIALPLLMASRILLPTLAALSRAATWVLRGSAGPAPQRSGTSSAGR
jgi:hypothetical protein